MDQVRHVTHLHGRDHFANQIGAVHDRQVDLGTAGRLPVLDRIHDGLVLSLIEALRPPDGYRFGRPARARFQSGQRTDARDRLTPGNLCHGPYPLTPPIVRPLFIFRRNV